MLFTVRIQEANILENFQFMRDREAHMDADQCYRIETP